jgi:hypothetical protein
MNVSCLCGVTLDIDSDRFPVPVICRACGRHLGVLDDGRVMCIQSDVTPQAALGPTSIQDQPRLSVPGIPCSSTAIAAGDPASSANLEFVSVLPSKTLALAVVIIMLVAAGFLVELGLWTRSATWYWTACSVAFCAIALGPYLFVKARRRDRDYGEWRREQYIIAVLNRRSFERIEAVRPRPGWHEVAFGVSLAAVLALCADFINLQGIYWVGHRDLEIRFVAVDADTGEPIPGAEIDVPKSRSPFCEDCDGAFKLITDHHGVARRRCKDCMCFGYSGGAPFFRRRETFGTHKPDWRFRASALGYRTCDVMHLQDERFRQTIDRGAEFATMRVAISLQPLAAAK